MQITSKHFSTHAYKGTNIIQLFARYSEICFIYHERNYFINIFLLDRKWIARAYVCVFFFIIN